MTCNDFTFRHSPCNPIAFRLDYADGAMRPGGGAGAAGACRGVARDERGAERLRRNTRDFAGAAERRAGLHRAQRGPAAGSRRAGPSRLGVQVARAAEPFQLIFFQKM